MQPKIWKKSYRNEFSHRTSGHLFIVQQFLDQKRGFCDLILMSWHQAEWKNWPPNLTSCRCILTLLPLLPHSRDSWGDSRDRLAEVCYPEHLRAKFWDTDHVMLHKSHWLDSANSILKSFQMLSDTQPRNPSVLLRREERGAASWQRRTIPGKKHNPTPSSMVDGKERELRKNSTDIIKIRNENEGMLWSSKKRICSMKMCLCVWDYLDYIFEYWRNLQVWTRNCSR